MLFYLLKDIPITFLTDEKLTVNFRIKGLYMRISLESSRKYFSKLPLVLEKKIFEIKLRILLENKNEHINRRTISFPP